MIAPHLSPHDEARERREEKARRLFGLPRVQMKKQRERLVPLPKQWIHTDGAQMIESWRSRWAIIFQHCPRHLPANHQPAEQRWYVFAINRASAAAAETLGLLLSVTETLDAAINVAAQIDGTTS